MTKVPRRSDPNSMEHMNGDQVVAIRIVTTGDDPFFHEMVQICIMPLDYDLKQRKDVMPFFTNLACDYPERIIKGDVHFSKIQNIISNSHDRDKAVDLFENWKKKLGLPFTKWGREKKLIPLSHGYSRVQPFIMRWLGTDGYDDIFEHDYRDTEVTANYLNEHASFHCRTVPYFKTDLTWCCTQHSVPLERVGDPMLDCRAIAALYRAQSLVGLF